TLSQNAETISAWGNNLSNDADILIFGCDLASTDAGVQFVDAFAQMTGADISASDDQTGSSGLGGDWYLEYAHGQIEAETLIDQDTELSWQGLLATPTAANNTVTTNEDTTYTFADSDFNYSDGDGDPMASVKITTLESVGSLKLSGIDVTINQVITKADIDAGNLTFIPVTAHNGTGYDSFGFSVNDGTTDSVSSYTMTLDVTAVNDAPTFDSPDFSSNTISTDADGARDVQVADVDGDGDMDVLSASSNDGEIAWYENDGSENFTAHTITTISTASESAYSVHVADLDGDGDMDVFSASYADDEIAWYENDGSENFTTHVIDSGTTANGATSVNVADLDGDGDLDVLSSSLWSGDIVWYENDGSENFTTHTISASDYPLDVTIADVDNDGDMDLLSVEYYSGDITWLENDGSENFTEHTIDTFSTASEVAGSVHVADVDGDGDLDVLATIYGDDKINWYENDGSENFTTHTITSSADGAFSVATADIDGDGDLDILSASELDD
ncbi:MAG: DUF4347 domain-containing protein, partial [Gammaproteobacteria bacterium]|nr:DUF4347 domain-containing protein [Gammaproteobacteria bacterium]